MIEEVSNFRRNRRVGRNMSVEVGSGVRTTKKTGSFIISSSSFFSCLKGPEPHSDLLSGVFDLCNPFPRRPLSNSNKLVLGVVARASLLEFAWFAGRDSSRLILELMKFHSADVLKRRKERGAVVIYIGIASGFPAV